MTVNTLTPILPATLAGAPEDYARLRISREKTAPFEDAMRTDGARGSYEWWYFDAHLDDGTKLVVVFYTKGTGDPSDPLTPKISINIDLAGGRRIERILNATPDQFSASRDRCDVRIAGNTFAGDLHMYRIQATIDDVSVDIDLTGLVPAWRPRTGHWYFGDPGAANLFAWFLSVPHGRVRARYTIDGVTRTSAGIGYHDHNFGDVPMSTLIHDWYWARGNAGPYSVVVSYITAEERFGYQPLPILLIAKRGVIIADDESKMRFSAEDVHVDEETGKPVANLTRYEYADDNDRYVVTFTREQTILRNKQVDILTPERRAAAIAAGFNGVYLRFTGQMAFEHYQHGRKVADLREPAMWELMYFGRPRINGNVR